MSDFLSNLIARSFTDAPAIQPRVPSLFETAGDEFPGEPQSPTPAIAAYETVAPRNAPAPGHVSESSPMGETATTKIAKTKSVTDVANARAEAEESLPKRDSRADMSEARAEESPPKPDAPAAQNTPVIAQVPRPTVHASKAKKLELETKKVVIPADTFRDGTKDAHQNERFSEVLSEPRRIQPFRRKNFSAIEPRSSKSAPTIRVNIGRIEVRAIHPPPPTPGLTKPAPPKLSLEDYLRRREKGSR